MITVLSTPFTLMVCLLYLPPGKIQVSIAAKMIIENTITMLFGTLKFLNIIKDLNEGIIGV